MTLLSNMLQGVNAIQIVKKGNNLLNQPTNEWQLNETKKESKWM